MFHESSAPKYETFKCNLNLFDTMILCASFIIPVTYASSLILLNFISYTVIIFYCLPDSLKNFEMFRRTGLIIAIQLFDHFSFKSSIPVSILFFE